MTADDIDLVIAGSGAAGLMLARVLSRYWLDVSTRRLTRRDRYLTVGAALIGPC